MITRGVVLVIVGGLVAALAVLGLGLWIVMQAA